MRRMGLAGLMAALAFALAPAAAHAWPNATVSTNLSPAVSPSLAFVGERAKDGVGPAWHGDGFGLNPPTLYAAAGGEVTIAVDAPVDAVKAWYRAVELTILRVDERTYKATLPADAQLPGEFWVSLEYSTAKNLGTVDWTANLDAVPPPPPPPAVPAPPTAAPAPEPPAAPTTAHLSGRRLAIVVACPVEASRGCAGTLRAAGKRLAFSGLAPGARRTLRATVSKRVAKQLRRAREVRVDIGRVKGFLPLR